MDARHQALREVLLRRAEEALAREADVDERVAYERLIQSLQNRWLVWEDVCMFVVELSFTEGHCQCDSRSDFHGRADRI